MRQGGHQGRADAPLVGVDLAVARADGRGAGRRGRGPVDPAPVEPRDAEHLGQAEAVVDGHERVLVAGAAAVAVEKARAGGGGGGGGEGGGPAALHEDVATVGF